MSNKCKNAWEKAGMEQKTNIINVEMQNRDLKCLVEAFSDVKHRMIHEPLTIDFARWQVFPKEIADLLEQLVPYTKNLDTQNPEEGIVIPMEQTLWNAYSNMVYFAHIGIQNEEQRRALKHLDENNDAIEDELGNSLEENPSIAIK